MKIEEKSAIQAIKESTLQQDLKPVQKKQQIKNEDDSNTGKTVAAKEKIKVLKADTETLNKLAIFIGYNLRFKVHEATKQLIVQVVDPTRYPEKIIKEIPEEKFLDILAQIKNAVGIFMDDYV
ncbi:MAG: hypothetical protein XD78_0173 [Desulfotomaculum sp. 46_296]|nr:MAG: hypothetical protein XD78_0173 [Desulfotomaculum sp. 46_296]HAU32295.1 hypothetical protein [Desulfotomaculum sp.]